MDELIYFGSAVKALGDGRVGGYLVEFTDYEAQAGTPPDLVREFFTKSTDFDVEPGEKRSVYFDHGQDPVLKRRRLGRAELKTDDVGVWAETILDTRDKYLKKIYELAEAGKLGWSSGSAPHLVEKARKSDGFVEIVAWPIAEASLTHRPCNPFSAAVPLKSFLEAREAEAGGEQSAKNVLDDELSTERDSVWRVWSAFTSIVEKSARTAADAAVTGVEFDHESKIREAAFALPDKLLPPVLQQVSDFLNSDSREHFYLKSALDELIASGSELVSDSDLEGHSQAVVSAVAEFASKGAEMVAPLGAWLERLREKQRFRQETKAGRVISQANRDRMASVMAKLKELMPVLEEMHGALGELHAMGEPKQGKSVDDDTLRGMVAQFEMTRRRIHTATRS